MGGILRSAQNDSPQSQLCKTLLSWQWRPTARLIRLRRGCSGSGIYIIIPGAAIDYNHSRQ